MRSDQSPVSPNGLENGASSRSAAKRVLVVDGNRQFVEVLTDILAMQGYEIAEAYRAADVARSDCRNHGPW